jgi:hypothetical protein
MPEVPGQRFGFFVVELNGTTIGQGNSLRITAPLELHRAALQQSAALAADTAWPAERKAHRVYATRIAAAE